MVDINLKRPDVSRGQRTVQNSESMGGDDASFNDSASNRSHRGSGSKGPWILLLTIVILVLIGGYLFKDKLMDSGSTGIAEGNYQAVFLTNGQVYFGKLSEVQKSYLKLNSIYYLQVTPVLQTGTADEVSGNPPQQQQQLSLVKLGNELHGPVDEMFINREHVLFIEDLKEDGRVVQAIKDYEEGQQ